MIDDEMRSGLLPPGHVSLTFDDGPGETVGPGPGPRTLDLARHLAAEGIAATFFMCGQHVSAHPTIPAAVLALGHTVGHHSHHHPDLLAADDDSVRRDLRSCLDELRAAGVTGPLPFRPPYGRWDGRVAAAVRADPRLSQELTGVYGWDLDSQDWKEWDRGGGDVLAVAERVARTAASQGGGVVLMHDSTADPGEDGRRRRAGNRALDAVAILVPLLRARGLTFKALPT